MLPPLRPVNGPTAGLALLLTLAAASPAAAHALGAECRLRDGRVEVEAYYDDDTPAPDAKVRVLDPQENTIVQGRTDAQGRWSFPTPRPGKYRVIVDAGAGHRATVPMTVPASEDVTASLLSDGPSRQEFTRFPWLKAGLGLAVIGGFSLALWLSRRVGRPDRDLPRPDSLT
jgi:nickel transport protein